VDLSSSSKIHVNLSSSSSEIQVNLLSSSFSYSKIQWNLSFFFPKIRGESLLKVTPRKKLYTEHESHVSLFDFHMQEICESVRAELKTPLPTPHMEECFLLTLPNIEELKTSLPTPHMEECLMLTLPNIEAALTLTDPLQLVQVRQEAGARPEDDHVEGMEAEEPQEVHADQLPEATGTIDDYRKR
jgi:hypothetical protein